MNDVLEQHSHGHRTNTTRDWGDLRGHLGGGLKVHITNQTLSRLLRRVRLVVDTDVDDNGARLEPVSLHHLGLTNGSDNNVRILHDTSNIGGLRVADSHSSVGILEQVAHGATDDIAAAENDRFLACGVNPTGLQKLHHSERGARNEQRTTTTLGQLADVDRAKSIYILLICNGRGNGVFRHVAGEGQLDQDAMHAGVIVCLGDLLEKLQLGARFGDIDQGANDVGLAGVREASSKWVSNDKKIYLFSGLKLHAHIGA